VARAQAENASGVLALENKLDEYPPTFELYRADRRVIRESSH
jgi:hypothetical protein